MGDQGGESFLTRWARLKRQSGEAPRSSPAPEPQDPRDEVESTPASPERSTSASDPAAENAAPPSEADFADVDFDALDQTSDYTRFMQPGVPEAIRHKALRRLWASDPVLSMPDELNDYMGDYTDAAVAATGRVLTTAYKVGRGFLDDDEVAAWERLGRPEPAEPTPGSVAGANAETPPEQPSGGESASRSLATRPEEPEGSPVAPEERGSAPAEPAAPNAPTRRGQG